MKADSTTADTGPRVIGPWRKPLSSGDQGGCFEFARSTLGVAVRDSKLGEASPVLHFTRFELQCMLAGAKAGEFDDLT